MKLINPKVEIIEQQPDIEGIYKQIEIAGRTAYRSENKITEDSAKKFVDMLIRRDHGAALEHGTVYLKNNVSGNVLYKYLFNPHSYYYKDKYPTDGKVTEYVTTNYRVLIENDWLDDLKYLCEPTEHHEKRVTVKFITDRATANEFVRHRTFSFMQESTRYCNYSLGKFGSELTFIIPTWLNIPEGKVTIDSFGTPAKPNEESYDFLSGLGASERSYFRLLNQGHTPQQARQVLPNALKTELIMTGTIEQWEGFFKLRCAPDVHPDARYLAEQTKKLFINKGYING